ncbi:MAG: NAD(P)H-hydrate epimerase [Pirellulales bacterium]|nr:NAD(P)H-hydrate epimerase [Pirellulales bacterium]
MQPLHLPPVLSRAAVRRVDQLAVERYGMSSLVLMENAGRGVADALAAVAPSLASVHLTHSAREAPVRFECPVTILCGKGNNAGDGLVLARHLHIRGVRAKACLLFAANELVGDARANYEILRRADAPIVELSAHRVGDSLQEHAWDTAWLVDAMLGTGAAGEPREPIAAAIHWMNRHPARRLAIDLPSGLDCDTGAPASATVRADLTCTFVALKPGFLQPAARPFLGEVHVASIGVPPRLVWEAAAV